MFRSVGRLELPHDVVTNLAQVQLYLFSNFDVNTLDNGSGIVNDGRFPLSGSVATVKFFIGKEASVFHDFSVYKHLRLPGGVRVSANVVLSGSTIILDFHFYSDLADELEKILRKNEGFDHGHDRQTAGGDEAGSCLEVHWSVSCPF